MAHPGPDIDYSDRTTTDDVTKLDLGGTDDILRDFVKTAHDNVRRDVSHFFICLTKKIARTLKRSFPSEGGPAHNSFPRMSPLRKTALPL